MKFFELCEICNFNEEPEIYVENTDCSVSWINWNGTINKYVSDDYKYIYDDDEEIIGVNAEIVLSEEDLQNATVVNMDIGKWAKIKVRL